MYKRQLFLNILIRLIAKCDLMKVKKIHIKRVIFENYLQIALMATNLVVILKVMNVIL